jgi:aldose 1-epimerase
VALARRGLALALAPSLGGAIASFTCNGRPVLRLPHPAPVHADQLACFPLVPFSNRVRDGLFSYRGRTIRLPRNHFDPHPLHGEGWTASWRVADATEERAVLVYDHDGLSSWPWRFRAEQQFHLGDDGLVIDLALLNLADEPFPAGLGLHPYFPRAGAILRTSVAQVWLSDDEKMPTRLAPVPPGWDFSRGLAIEGLTIDHCFAGWSGDALIEYPHGRCRLTASKPLDKLVIYVPEGGDYFCVEPVSNVIDGFNLRARCVPDTGIVDLAPGARLTAQTSLVLDGSW